MIGPLMAALLAIPSPGVAGMARLVAMGRDGLHVTEGRLGEGQRLQVDAPKFRAVAPTADGSRAELRFTYLGRTGEAMPLRSGELREQLGLKLRAADGCNVLYAMWRVAPRPGVVVSLKRNPGQHRSDDCTNEGYQNLRPDRAAAVPPLRPGSAHVLAATLARERLEVRVDREVVWEGPLPREALELRGPAGLRSDNVRFEFELAVDAAEPR
ncbi:MAG: hypothetical protein ACJ79L_12635 [Anaeromyxobacteraceae bacterium]